MKRIQTSDDLFETARRHSRRVRFLKRVLPIGAIAFVAVFIGAVYFSSPGSLGFQLGSTSVENGRLVMQNPKLDGFTSDNRAYSMSASRASQIIGQGNLIDLAPDFHLTINNDAAASDVLVQMVLNVV